MRILSGLVMVVWGQSSLDVSSKLSSKLAVRGHPSALDVKGLSEATLVSKTVAMGTCSSSRADGVAETLQLPRRSGAGGMSRTDVGGLNLITTELPVRNAMLFLESGIFGSLAGPLSLKESFFSLFLALIKTKPTAKLRNTEASMVPITTPANCNGASEMAAVT